MTNNYDNIFLNNVTSYGMEKKPVLQVSGQVRLNSAWPRGYKTFSMLNSAEHEIYPALNVKMPTIVGILTFISMINTTSKRTLETSSFVSIVVFMSS